MEDALRKRMEDAAEAYKAAIEPHKRIDAIMIYAKALKDLSNFLMENIPPEKEREMKQSG
jgi:hypothetical protein